MCFFFFKQKTAYDMRISDWSSDVCSSDLQEGGQRAPAGHGAEHGRQPRHRLVDRVKLGAVDLQVLRAALGALAAIGLQQVDKRRVLGRGGARERPLGGAASEAVVAELRQQDQLLAAVALCLSALHSESLGGGPTG